MKNIKTIAILLMVLAFSFSTEAQTSTTKDQNNYVVLTRNLSQLQVIFATSKDLKIEDGVNYGEFHVIVCGETVKELTDHTVREGLLAKAKEAKVNIVICGFSLDNFDVDRNAISKDLKIVDNGLLYNFQLQKKGFISIEL